MSGSLFAGTPDATTAAAKPGQRAVMALRRRIATGELPAGSRVAEIPIALSLGVSRMPVRLAFRILEREGLLVRTGKRGYAVRGLSADEVTGAVRVRGVLEGLAARQLAARGLSKAGEKLFLACLVEGDALFAKQSLSEDDVDAYHALNARFHQAIVEGSGNPAVASALLGNNTLPFAAASALTVDRFDLEAEFHYLANAHRQHHLIFQAIRQGRADDAFRLMEDHALVTLRPGLFPLQSPR